MSISVRSIAPVAHLPLILGMLRKLEVAAIIDQYVPPHPNNVLSGGRGVEALVLAVLDGHHALYKVGQRLQERGMLPLLQEGLAVESLNDYRLGQILDALFAVNLNRLFGALALKALEVYAIPTSWIHHDTTTLALYGAYEQGTEEGENAAEQESSAAAPPVPPRPVYGQSKGGQEGLKQVILSLGVSGDGGLPLRMGIRDGNTSDSTEASVAIEECLKLGLEGVIGIVADSKAYSKRTLGLCIEKEMGLVTLVPRTCALRQELEGWGQAQASLPLLREKAGRTRGADPSRWHGQSVQRAVEVEYADGRVALEKIRFVVVHSSQLAQREAKRDTKGQSREAEAVAAHLQKVEAKCFACRADAEAAIAEYEGRGAGRRGRKPQPWRYHTLRYRVEAFQQRKKRPGLGRPRGGEPPEEETRYCLRVDVQARGRADKEQGWTVLATTVGSAVCTDAEILDAYLEQGTTVEPGFRWIKNPAAITPVWLEKPERVAALAMLTVVGLLVYALIQRQVRLYLQEHDREVPGNKGRTTTPTGAVVLSWFTSVMMVALQMDTAEVRQVYGLQEHHWLVCEALGIDRLWYEVPTVRENSQNIAIPP